LLDNIISVVVHVVQGHNVISGIMVTVFVQIWISPSQLIIPSKLISGVL